MKIRQVITGRKHPAVTATLSHLAILHLTLHWRQQGSPFLSQTGRQLCRIHLFWGLVYSNPRWGGGWLGKAALTVSARPSATSRPHEHNTPARTRLLARSTLLLEYEICMDHKEHMDHLSQYPLRRTIRNHH